VIASTWGELSQSSKQALYYAWAAAQERAPDPTATTPLDGFDLLVGMMLSHPGTSEAELTFRRFDLVAGQALPQSYPTLTLDKLEKRLTDLPSDAEYPTSTDVDQILQAAVEAHQKSPRWGQAESDRVTPLGAVWLALLTSSTPAATAIYELLTRRGVNTSEFLAAVSSWWNSPGADYAGVLSGFRAAPIDIVNYKADQSVAHDASGSATTIEDFVGVAAEVDAFAYLLASRNLSPPLAIGLFGDWGAGKSFFLDAIKRRIAQLTQDKAVIGRPQSTTQFWKHIVQVEFNAWHYVEGDLWSSLVDHIFNQLSLASDKDGDNIVVQRQRHLLRQMESTAETIKQLDEQKKALQIEVAWRQRAVNQWRHERDEALVTLANQRAKLVGVEVLKQTVEGVGKALAAVNIGKAGDPPVTLGQQAAALQTARGELSRGSALFRPYLKHPGWLIVLVACLFIVPLLIALAVDQWPNSGAAAAVGGFASLLAMLTGAIGVASNWVERRLSDLKTAQDRVDKRISAEEKRVQAEVVKSEVRLASAEAALEKSQAKHAQQSDRLASIEQDLQKSPQQVLNEFLRERLAAGEYRRRLGVPAIIRRDFRDLANLIGYQNAYLLETSEKGKQDIREAADNKVLEDDNPLIVNRIVLYIDDLDRCPDAKVIEVLQAVHMLLAFPLFVVVVAVDARWLASALQNRYPALAGGGYMLDGRPARPSDYLEKIFQVPFWVSKLSDEARQAIVRGLLGPHVRGTVAATTSANSNDAAPEVNRDAAIVLHDMINTRTEPPQLDIAALQMTEDELRFLEQLTPMLGDTPRSVKRFVNLYQLLKILRRARPWFDPSSRDEEVAALLLAMTERLPGLFKLIGKAPARTLRELAGDSSSQPLDADLAGLEEEREYLRGWLSHHEGLDPVNAEHLADIARDVRRFLFQSFEFHAVEAQARRPQLVHVIQER
jgi:hypothetical protein